MALILGGLSSPFSVVLWPLFVARFLRDRSRFNQVLLAVAMVTAVIQLWNMPARVAGSAPISVTAVPMEGFVARIAYAFLGQAVSDLAPLTPPLLSAGSRSSSRDLGG